MLQRAAVSKIIPFTSSNGNCDWRSNRIPPSLNAPRLRKLPLGERERKRKGGREPECKINFTTTPLANRKLILLPWNFRETCRSNVSLTKRAYAAEYQDGRGGVEPISRLNLSRRMVERNFGGQQIFQPFPFPAGKVINGLERVPSTRDPRRNDRRSAR